MQIKFTSAEVMSIIEQHVRTAFGGAVSDDQTLSVDFGPSYDRSATVTVEGPEEKTE